jgi:hypothetical protein
MQRRWYWKLYFFLGVLLTALMVVLLVGFSLYFPEQASALEIVSGWVALPLYVVQLIGLYGFVYWRRFGYERLWQLIFAATVIETVWTFYSVGDDLPDLEGYETGLLAFTAVAGTALTAPLLIALFIYAFRSSRLWAEANLA